MYAKNWEFKIGFGTKLAFQLILCLPWSKSQSPQDEWCVSFLICKPGIITKSTPWGEHTCYHTVVIPIWCLIYNYILGFIHNVFCGAYFLIFLIKSGSSILLIFLRTNFVFLIFFSGILSYLYLCTFWFFSTILLLTSKVDR